MQCHKILKCHWNNKKHCLLIINFMIENSWCKTAKYCVNYNSTREDAISQTIQGFLQYHLQLQEQFVTFKMYLVSTECFKITNTRNSIWCWCYNLPPTLLKPIFMQLGQEDINVTVDLEGEANTWDDIITNTV